MVESAALALEAESGVALFHQIAVILQDRILSGQLSAGDRLPTERDICETFGVSRITAKRALDELARKGIVERARGRGTIVRSSPLGPRIRAAVDGWYENLARMGESTRARVLEFDYRPAPKHVAEALQIAAGEEVQRSVRVRSLDDTPFSCLETWLPAEIGRSFTRKDLEDVALLRLLEREGVGVAAARQTITAAVAAPNVAAVLGVPAGAPLLDVRRVALAEGGRPVEFIRVLYRPELYGYEMELTRVRSDDGARWRAVEPESDPAVPD